jgi:uncharacterized tellurite resistance protein B-like protein
MTEDPRDPKEPRFEDEQMIVETLSTTEVYDARYLVAALFVFVAKGDGTISDQESAEMVELLNNYFGISSAESLNLLTMVLGDAARNPDFESLLADISRLLSVAEKEEIALMMLKVVAADGRKDAEEMEKLRLAAEIIEIPPDTLHRAYDRYFEETQV